MSKKNILKIKNLSKNFFLHEQEQSIPSAQNISLEMSPYQLTALTGASGVGKSSILKCIYGTYLPSSGSILYKTQKNQWIDLAQADPQTILELRRKEISFVTQFLHCLPRQSTIDVVAQPLFDLGINRENAREKAKELLTQIELPKRLWSISPVTFSGGEKQRVNLARAMMINPRLLLLDEPTASLDQHSIEKVIKMINHLKQMGTGILAIFHDSYLIQRLADVEIKIISLPNSHKSELKTVNPH